MRTAYAHDGSELHFEVYGNGPAVLLYNADPEQPAHPLRQHVLDFKDTLVDGLADRYRVVVMSYPGTPKPDTLTPDSVTADMLAIADAAEVGKFAWWGYSFGGVAGLQLALRTDRITALAMTGFPPISGPYQEMLHYSRVLASVDTDALGAPIPEETRAQLPQFVTYYERLQDFDDRAAQAKLTMPRLCWVGGADEIAAGAEKICHLGETVAQHQRELEDFGWEVELLPGEDHLGAMAADVVLPRLAGFLDRHLYHSGRTSLGSSFA